MLLYQDISNKVLGAYYQVLRNLTTGLAESVYLNALCIELDEAGLSFERQKQLVVYYKGHVVGNFVADIVVESKIILELKVVSKLVPAHAAQLLNYLSITGFKVGYLLNFGESREYKRLIR
ncbi:MAG: GxxExxY protein [Prevotella sp.]|nr:GxxExxY protein [Prevotella sp.]